MGTKELHFVTMDAANLDKVAKIKGQTKGMQQNFVQMVQVNDFMFKI